MEKRMKPINQIHCIKCTALIVGLAGDKHLTNVSLKTRAAEFTQKFRLEFI